MSPAKRLSRKRFRALCERCAEYLGDGPLTMRAIKRVSRYERMLGMSWDEAGIHIAALARLAR